MTKMLETGHEALWRLASRRPGLWLQPTDWKWLSALEVYGILGLGQLTGLAMERDSDPGRLVRLFFNVLIRKEHWLGRAKRVRRLAKTGYIQDQHFPFHPPVFTLTEKSHGLLKEVGLSRLQGFRHRISDAMVAHELTVAGVGLVLSEMLGLEVLAARERVEWKGRGGRPATDSRTVPDLWIADDSEPKGVEIERGQKSKEEYRERWRSLRLTLPENGLLLYLTVWPGGKRFIQELAQDYRADFVLVAELKEFMQARGRCRFVGYHPGKSLTLGPRPFPNAGGASRVVAPAVPPALQDRPAGPSWPAAQGIAAGGGLSGVGAPRTTGGMDQ